MRTSVAPLVDRVKGSVVTIKSTKLISRVRREDPFTQFFREQLGGPPPVRQETQMGLGSGFVIDRAGTVLTNNHVIAGADAVRVVLIDGRTLDAKIVGSDPDTDVAVLKIGRPPTDLRPVVLGDSEKVRVGDYVLAIGNPLGLGQTVTMGIVSAKNRMLEGRLIDYEDFIQTDAAINQGNSGGPLFNFAGEVIGVNSAILNPAMAMNVGFAIPINLARNIADQLVRTGQVARGMLGAKFDEVTPELARRLGVPTSGGARVVSVTPQSPADRAGLRGNDVVVEIAGRPIDGVRRLMQVVAYNPPGATVNLVYFREGKRLETKATLTENPELGSSGVSVLGLRVKAVSDREREELGLEHPAVRVMGVDPRGAASGSLRSDDLVVGIGNRWGVDVRVLQELERALAKGRTGRLIIARGGALFALTLSGAR
jgi:Do/DeqQ family serine protease